MEILNILGAIIVGFTAVILIVPSILRVAHLKKLFEPFESRKVHKALIPPLGGVAIFIGFLLSVSITTFGFDFEMTKYLLVSVLLMFFIGLKDELINIDAKTKLLVQVFAAAILIIMGDIRFTNLHGVLGIYNIGFAASFIISLFAIVVITNAINLIDGIDGLAAGIVITATGMLGTWFFFVEQYQLSIISFALLGCLSAFFLYNVFGHTNKLFMGDSGSLVIGIILSTLVIRFNELNILPSTALKINAAPAVSFAVLIVPLVDTLRVMLIRISQKKSPFSPDNNHIHHRLLKLFNNHLKVTLTLVFASVLFVGVSFLLNIAKVNVNAQLLILILAATGSCFVPSLLLKRRLATAPENAPTMKDMVSINSDFIFAKSNFITTKTTTTSVINKQRSFAKEQVQKTSEPENSKAFFANRLYVIGNNGK